jgi:hypothetical protein
VGGFRKLSVHRMHADVEESKAQEGGWEHNLAGNSVSVSISTLPPPLSRPSYPSNECTHTSTKALHRALSFFLSSSAPPPDSRCSRAHRARAVTDASRVGARQRQRD